MKKIIEKSWQWLNMCSDLGSDDDKKQAKELIDYIQKNDQLIKELIEKLVALYKINQNINNIIAEFNYTAKEKIGLNVIDLMHEIDIEYFIRKITDKKWEDIINEKDN